MSYIIKNTSGLLSTRFTDAGRMKLSKGKLDIRYFQVGDSEITYTAIPGYNQTKNFVIEPAYNAQNISQEPESNKIGMKYPFYIVIFESTFINILPLFVKGLLFLVQSVYFAVEVL